MSDLPLITPGQAAYEAWRGKLIPSMENMPGFSWTEIPAATRTAWEEIAAVASEAHRGLYTCSCNRPSVNDAVPQAVITPGARLYRREHPSSMGHDWRALSQEERSKYEARARKLHK